MGRDRSPFGSAWGRTLRRSWFPSPDCAERRESGFSSTPSSTYNRQRSGEVDEAIFDRSRDTAMMTYKGYRGSVRFDDAAEIFHGEVTGVRDVVTFQGRTVDELKTAFRESIDDYLEFCESRGEEPDKAYSGRFLLRVDPILHRRLVELSGDDGESLNNWIASRLQGLVGTTHGGQVGGCDGEKPPG